MAFISPSRTITSSSVWKLSNANCYHCHSERQKTEHSIGYRCRCVGDVHVYLSANVYRNFTMKHLHSTQHLHTEHWAPETGFVIASFVILYLVICVVSCNVINLFQVTLLLLTALVCLSRLTCLCQMSSLLALTNLSQNLQVEKLWFPPPQC
jgi:hypothetical protein